MNSYSTSWWSSLLINRPREDERLSWPCWLTYSRRLTYKVIIRPTSSWTDDHFGQGKFAGQRPAFYHSATPPIVSEIRWWLKKGWVPVDVFSTVWQQKGHTALKSQQHQLPLMECTFPPLLSLHRRPFSCLRRTWCDGVKEYVWRGRVKGFKGTSKPRFTRKDSC